MVSLLGSYLSRGRVWSAFVRVIVGKSKKEKKKKSRSMVRKFYIYFGLFQTCADFKSIRSYLFYALDMINIFPSANFPGHLKDGALQGGQPAGQCQTDFVIILCNTMMTIMKSQSNRL